MKVTISHVHRGALFLSQTKIEHAFCYSNEFDMTRQLKHWQLLPTIIFPEVKNETLKQLVDNIKNQLARL